MLLIFKREISLCFLEFKSRIKQNREWALTDLIKMCCFVLAMIHFQILETNSDIPRIDLTSLTNTKCDFTKFTNRHTEAVLKI